LRSACVGEFVMRSFVDIEKLSFWQTKIISKTKKVENFSPTTKIFIFQRIKKTFKHRKKLFSFGFYEIMRRRRMKRFKHGNIIFGT
jgi:hypothetical protein